MEEYKELKIMTTPMIFSMDIDIYFPKTMM